MQYTGFDRFIARLLTAFPRLKRFIKLIYQRINYYIYKKGYYYKVNRKIVLVSCKDQESFFGYYDKSPVNTSNQYIIFHSSELSTWKKPDSQRPVNIVLKNLKNGNSQIIDKSFSYNWQQGSRLQWLDAERFIFNDYDADRDLYISKIVNAGTDALEKSIDFPVYDCWQDYALTLNFDRLALLRPDYGYRNRIDKGLVSHENLNVLDTDGLFYVDLRKNTCSQLVSFADIIQRHPDSRMSVDLSESIPGAKHKFNHIMIAPNGKKAVFLHRYFRQRRKYDRLILVDIHSRETVLLSDQEMVSHYCWMDNSKIIAFMRDYTLGDRYFSIDIHTGKKEIFGKGLLDNYGDGHPSIFGEKMIFDTYPNKGRYKELLIYFMNQNKVERIGEFFESFRFYGETRCDLHPRWSNDGKFVFIDSVHTGRRGLYQIEL
ncbi:glycosyl transferase [Thermoproteota archaeon]